MKLSILGDGTMLIPKAKMRSFTREAYLGAGWERGNGGKVNFSFIWIEFEISFKERAYYKKCD